MPYTPTVYADGTSPWIEAANLNKTENALAATTTLAEDALPKSGGTMSGALTLGGTGNILVADTSLLILDATNDRATFGASAGEVRFSGKLRHDSTGNYTTNSWHDRSRVYISRQLTTAREETFLAANIFSNVEAKQAATFTERIEAFSARIKDASGVNQLAITGATNATPIVITTATHGYTDGDRVSIWGVLGNTNANGQYYVDVLSTTTFALYTDSTLATARAGNAAYTSGGTVTNKPIMYCYMASVIPNVARGGMTAPVQFHDDIAGYVASNDGTAKGTDAFYLAKSPTISATRKSVTGAVNNGSGLIRLTVTGHGLTTGDSVAVWGVGGTTETVANAWNVTVIDANTLDLQGSTFTNAYTSAGSLAVVSASKSEWTTQLTFDSAADYGIRLNGDYNQYGLDLYSGAYKTGQIRLKNSSPIMARNYLDTADMEVGRFNFLNEWNFAANVRLAGQFSFNNNCHLSFTTSAGSKIGTATGQKMGFWNVTPVIQPAGWGSPTGTATRTTFDTTTVTLPQLAERVKAIIDDDKLIGIKGA